MQEQGTHTVVALIHITKQRIKVLFDTEEILLLFQSECNRLGIEKGTRFSDFEMERMKNEYMVKRSKKKALELLTRSDCSEKELFEKLVRYGFSSEISKNAVEYVKQYHYVDDNRFARNFVQFRSGKLSNRKIRMELCQKGIDLEVVEKLIELRDDKIVLNQLVQNAVNRHGNREMDERFWNRLKSSLYRKGFSSYEIEKTITIVKMQGE